MSFLSGLRMSVDGGAGFPPPFLSWNLDPGRAGRMALGATGFLIARIFAGAFFRGAFFITFLMTFFEAVFFFMTGLAFFFADFFGFFAIKEEGTEFPLRTSGGSIHSTHNTIEATAGWAQCKELKNGVNRFSATFLPLYVAGSCCVTQWNDPHPQVRIRLSIGTMRRPGKHF